MPKMNGLEFLHALREDPALRALTVVVLTTSDDERDRIEAYNLNVAGYILKPVTFAAFVEAMATLNKYWTINEFPSERMDERWTILVVDDDDLDRMAVRRALQGVWKCRWRVQEAQPIVRLLWRCWSNCQWIASFSIISCRATVCWRCWDYPGARVADPQW